MIRSELLGPNTSEILSGYEIVKSSEWKMRGSETYSIDLWVKDLSTTEERRLIAKACVAMSPGQKVEEWTERREEMQDLGIQTPELVYSGAGMVVEEYIPLSLKEAYKRAASQQEREVFEADFINMFSAIFGHGYSPLSFHDLRSRGNDVVMIDFGFDLGSKREIDRCDTVIPQLGKSAFNDLIGVN